MLSFKTAQTTSCTMNDFHKSTDIFLANLVICAFKSMSTFEENMVSSGTFEFSGRSYMYVTFGKIHTHL